MSDFKTRLEAEQKQLEERLQKLNDFLQSKQSQNIEPEQRALLVIQAKAMDTYLECLNERLKRLR